MGAALVQTMLRAGVEVVVSDLNPDAVARLVEQGARPATSLAELAGRCTVVGVCVPADPHVRAVLDGPDGLLAHLAHGSCIAIHSTVLPETVEWAADAARPGGVAVVEAAVTGGVAMANEGRSTFLLGGDAADFAALGPILDACSEVRIHAGELGQASRLKLCINLQSYVTFTGVYEAGMLARRVGLDLDALKTAMEANGQLGLMTRNYMMLLDFTPEGVEHEGTRRFLQGYVDIADKDLDLIARLGEEAGFPVPTAELVRTLTERIYRLETPGE
jgi:3-hydroxyisobutyrate dehydrogenase-like beta-hydroxyacid dehydrogenase